MRYVNSEEEHRCSNCGFSFTGNYCPTCSQRAGVGSIWCLAFVFVFVYSAILLLSHFIFFTGEAPDIQVAGYTFPAKNFMTYFYVIIGTLILSTGYLINRLATRKARRQ